jgi:hypothetical protein
MGHFEAAAADRFRTLATRTHATTQGRSRPRTPITLLVVLTIATLTLLLPSSAFALPQQGIYYGCYVSCEAGLDAARAAGLSFVIAPPSPSMAAALHERGMTAFWAASYHDPRPDLVQGFAAHPVTRGWYVADEPGVQDIGVERWWAQQIRALDPAHPTLSVHFGCSGAQASETMRPFTDAADWLGTDCYPVGPGSSRVTGPAFAGGARVAGRYGRTFWAVTQAASWAEMCGESCGRPETTWPSPREMQLMRDCAAAAGASVIAWFSLETVLRGGERRLRDLATAVRSPQLACPTGSQAGARSDDRRIDRTSRSGRRGRADARRRAALRRRQQPRDNYLRAAALTARAARA